MATKKATSSVAVAKKAPATKKSSHPTYAVMVNEAIVALKERTGSSQYAIAKHIEDNQKDLPPNFRKLLLVQLKKLVAAGKLTKVKHSFKLSAVSKPTAAKLTKPATEKKAPATKVVAKKTPAEKKSKSGAQVKATKVVAKAKAKAKTPVKAKKAAPVKASAKKPKSIKSPVKKVAAKKTAAKK